MPGAVLCSGLGTLTQGVRRRIDYVRNCDALSPQRRAYQATLFPRPTITTITTHQPSISTDTPHYPLLSSSTLLFVEAITRTMSPTPSPALVARQF